jgi:2-polyprenyl-3-methyl-5-hydroxy-6-metoxy-1,4-benzoquinol methylase
MGRYASTSPELDDAEQRWWRENGDLEEKFCWVQTPRIQRFIRGSYLQVVTDLVRPGSKVLELGCGTGWLTILLAQLGVAQIVGRDFSMAQIERAKRAALDAGVEACVRFEVAGPEALEGDERFDVIVMHAFLHHLSSGEIADVLRRAWQGLTSDGRLVVVEPIHYPDGPEGEPSSLRFARRLENLPRVMHARGLRQESEAETNVRQRLAHRHVGEPPFGPSPKETAFAPSEVLDHLESQFEVVDRRPCLCMSHLVAQELLIARLSQPRLWSALEPAVLAAARFADRSFLKHGPMPRTVWVFEAFVGKRRDW